MAEPISAGCFSLRDAAPNINVEFMQRGQIGHVGTTCGGHTGSKPFLCGGEPRHGHT